MIDMKNLLVFVSFLFLITNNVYAESGPASEYKITMKKVELCTAYPDANANDVDCTGAFVVGESTLAFDITSATAGNEVGTWISTTGIPIGTTYTHVRVTVDRDFTITGYAEADSNCWCHSITAGTYDEGTGKYLSRPAGTCVATEALASAAAESQLVWVSTRGTNRVCQEAACSSAGATEDVSNSVESDGVDMDFYGLAINVGAVTSEDLQIIYKLSTSYTAGPIAPKITIAFGTQNAFNGYEFTDGKCIATPYYPKVQITIAD